MFRLISFNLNGIRSAFTKGVYDWLLDVAPDVVCFQELKAQEPDLSEEMKHPKGFHAFYHAAEKKGYSGVGIWSKEKPNRVINGFLALPKEEQAHFPSLSWLEEFHAEGRYVRAEFDDYALISLYLPSGSSSEERQAAKFRFLDGFYPHLEALGNSGKKVVLCGDINIAHQEKDLKNWKSNQKNSGFLPEERAFLSKVFEQTGFCDVYRRLHPDATEDAYTWWSNRGQAWAKNVGWRLDYQMASEDFAKSARHATVYKTTRFSDHAPLIIDYERGEE